MAEPLRILHIASSYAPIVGGLERNLAQLGRRLVGMGHRVTVLTRRWPGTTAHQDDGGVTVVRVAAPGGGMGFLAGGLAWLAAHGSGFDVVQCHQLLSPALLGALGKPLHRAPVLVLVVAGGQYGEAATIRSRPFLTPRLALLRRVDRYLTLTAGNAEELAAVGLGSVPVTQVPNGVDTAAFAPTPPERRPELRRELGLGTPSGLLAFVGRLDEAKNLDGLLRAWAKAASGLPDAALALVGDGPQRRELEALAAGLGLGDGVLFLGQREDVPAVLAAADGFVLASHSEGMPNALLEAMAAGLPSLVTAVGAVPEMIDHGVQGLLVPPGDEAALAEGMARLLGDASGAAAMGAAARARALERHDFNAVARTMVDIYRSEMQRRSPCAA